VVSGPTKSGQRPQTVPARLWQLTRLLVARRGRGCEHRTARRRSGCEGTCRPVQRHWCRLQVKSSAHPVRSCSRARRSVSTSRSLLPFGSRGSRNCLPLRYASSNRVPRPGAVPLLVPRPVAAAAVASRQLEAVEVVTGPDVDADGRRAAIVGRLDRGVFEGSQDDQLSVKTTAWPLSPSLPGPMLWSAYWMDASPMIATRRRSRWTESLGRRGC
jgi:hypothetical protein